jgi:hypothetical protein
MRLFDNVRVSMRIASAALLAASVLCAQQTPDQQQGLPARATPADYQVQAKAGNITIAAEFTGHGIPTVGQEPLTSEDYIGVEVGIFGPPGTKLTLSATDFSLRINGKKQPMPSQPWGLVAKGVKDPGWVSPEAANAEPKSKGGVSSSSGGGGGSGRSPGDPPPPPPKVPIETLRIWQQGVRRAALALGERPLPQAGLVFFQHRGKTENLRSVELVYEGPAGTATLTLQ